MYERNPLVKLDIVLRFLYNKLHPPKATLKEIIDGTSTVLLEQETVFIQILDKLIKDGYISHEKSIEMDYKHSPLIPTTRQVNYYLITFDGVSFLEFPGGYASEEALSRAESIRVDTLESHQIQNSVALTKLTGWIAYGTVAAAVFAGLLLLWQVFLYFYPVHKDYLYWIWEPVPKTKK